MATGDEGATVRVEGEAVEVEAFASEGNSIATVPVHIQKIRRKIESDPAEPQYIETLWGTGYRFNS